MKTQYFSSSKIFHIRQDIKVIKTKRALKWWGKHVPLVGQLEWVGGDFPHHIIC